MAVLFSYDDFILLHLAFRFSRKKGGAIAPLAPPPGYATDQLRQAKTKAQSHVPSSFHSSVLVGKSVPSPVQVPSSQDIPCHSSPTHTHTIQDSTSSSLVPSDLHHHTAHSSSISSSSSTSTLVQDQDQGTTPPP